MEEKTANQEWLSLLNTVLHWRKGAAQGSTKHEAASWRRIRASLRRGATDATEHYAYPYVLPRLAHCDRKTQLTVIRLCALVAEHDKIPAFTPTDQAKFRSLGCWCYLVSQELAEDGPALDPTQPDTVASRLAFLHTQSAQEAITTIRRVMDIASTLDAVPALDFENLFRTFIYWGDGLSTASVRHRRRVLQDYYSGFVSPDHSITPSTHENS